MNIRQAILKTANLFEHKPEVYSFMNSVVPNDCRTPGCMAGFIGHFLGVKSNCVVQGPEYEEAFGVHYDVFFKRMSKLSKDDYFSQGSFVDEPKAAAAYLRQYADKYHPKTDHIPASIRQIFETQQVAA